MQKWTLREIIEHAKNHSPYYRELYKDLPADVPLDGIPIIDQAQFWKSQVLTEDPHGVVFKSGGSTGAPKFSYFTNVEWASFCEAFGLGMSKGILADGDRVANLFYSGDLYASFLFIKDSLQSIPTSQMRLSQFPIAGQTDHLQILKTLEAFNINVIVGVPSAILTMLEKYSHNRATFPKLKLQKILFGGEGLYRDQHQALLRIFPEVQISSIGCASVDGGLIGYSSSDCDTDEHRVFMDSNIIELVDPDTLEVIQEPDRVGKVILTNLTRKLMPIIRYPAGDLAVWVDKEGTPNRKFKLQGRSDEAARLGTISVYFEDMRAVIMKTLTEVTGLQFQMVLKHFDHLDELTIRIAGHGLRLDPKVIARVTEAFAKDKAAYQEGLVKKLIHPLRIEIVEMKDLEANSRTGKLKRVIDNRNL